MAQKTSNHPKTGKHLLTTSGNDFEEEFHEDQGIKIIDDIYIPPMPVKPSNLLTDQRLIIDTIEIINFKSYGGRSVLGPFYKSFNSIVGPNGSGKSNVIDSMLFVFGYRAQKLRSNKISSIIHKSEKLPNCEYAQVNVNFAMIIDKEHKKQEIIENSRFTISRVVTKDNNSYYMIDSQKVLFKDVSKRLEDFGIDLRYNRFLILQGEVEQISLMKPKGDGNIPGMLEYLEDIIGTSRYKDPIEKLTVKYNELNEKRTLNINRVNLCHKELNLLKDAKTEADRAVELENQTKIEKAKLIQWKMYKIKKKFEKHEVEYAQYEQKLNVINNEENNIQKEKLKLEEEETIKTADYDRIKAELKELQTKLEDCDKNDYYLKLKLQAAEKKLKKLNKEDAKNQEDSNELRKAILANNNNNQIEETEKFKSEIEEKLKQLEDSINTETVNVQKECLNLVNQREEYNHQLMKFTDEQTDKLKAKNEAYNKFICLKQKVDTIKDKYEQFKSKLEQITKETEEKNGMIERYQQEIVTEENKLKDFHKKYEIMEQKRSDLTEMINQKSNELHGLKESVSKAQSRDLIRNSLMEEKRKGSLKGIFGRLGDLGAIDKMYDIAVSTACGRLKNFVVDTIENAQLCVEFLKRNNLPPVTFIALDKLRVKWNENVSYPEKVPRLFDLIRVNDKRIRPAFYYALGETLVAQDIEQAKRITKNARYRVVTLRGDLIEYEGAMTGGGQPKSGGMGQSIMEINCEDVRSKISSLEPDIASLREERQSIDLEIDNVRNNVSKLEKDIMFMKDKLNSLQLEVKNTERLNQIKENLEKQKIELEKSKDNPEIAIAEREYEDAKSIYEKEMSKMDLIQEKKKEIENEIKKIFDRKLKSLKYKRSQLEKSLKDSQTKLNQILSEQKAIELKLKQNEENLANNKKSREEIEVEMNNIKNDSAKLESSTQEICAKYKNSQAECEIKGKELNEIKRKVREINVQFKDITNKKLDMKLEVDKRFKFIKEGREKNAQYKLELESIKLNPISFNSDDEENVEPMMIEEEDDEASLEGDENHSIEHQSNQNKIPILTVEELENLNPDSIEQNIKSIEFELSKMNPNYAAIKEFYKKHKEYTSKVNDLDEVTLQRNTYMEHLNETKHRRFKEFKCGFMPIARKLKEMYRTITLGGDADLEFIDSLDPFSEGVNFAVRPNKKSWKNNLNLSGGEKTLASLALIFALHHYKPSPLYIMDEIDAALDFKNVSIIANYIKQRTKNTQFLIISLRNNMYELADRLIGIYKTFNITKTLPFDPEEFDLKLNQSRTQETRCTVNV